MHSSIVILRAESGDITFGLLSEGAGCHVPERRHPNPPSKRMKIFSPPPILENPVQKKPPGGRKDAEPRFHHHHIFGALDTRRILGAE